MAVRAVVHYSYFDRDCFDLWIFAFSGLTRLVGRQEGIRPVKNRVVGCWRGYLSGGADLHMAQLMPLPLTVSCFSKIQIGFTFLVLAHQGSPGQRAVKWVCVCVCVCSRERHRRYTGTESGFRQTDRKSKGTERKVRTPDGGAEKAKFLGAECRTDSWAASAGNRSRDPARVTVVLSKTELETESRLQASATGQSGDARSCDGDPGESSPVLPHSRDPDEILPDFRLQFLRNEVRSKNPRWLPATGLRRPTEAKLPLRYEE